MRHNRSRVLVPSVLAVLAGTLLALPSARAQAPQNGRYPFPTPNNPVQVPEEPRIPDVNFPGGTVQEYIDYLRTVSPGNVVNAVVTEDLGNATIPAVRLRNVTPTQAAQLVDGLLSERREVRVDDIFSGTGGDRVLSMRFERSGNPYETSSTPLSICQINDIVAPSKDAGPLTSGTLPINTVLTAIEQAMKMIGGTPPEVKYHADSGLLLIKGGQQQSLAAMQVLSSLRESAGRVDALGGGNWTRSWTLVHCDPQQVVGAFREVFPPGSDQSEAIKVVGEPNTNSVAITAPRNMAVAADVLVRYVDRAPSVDREAIRMQAELQETKRLREELADRFAVENRRAEDIQKQQAQEVFDLRAALSEAQARIKMLESEKAAQPKK